MSLTVKDLKNMLETLNIPDDAEIWFEFPIASGVSSVSQSPAHESRVDERDNREDWICASTLGWSPGVNKVRIFHHPVKDQ